MTIVSGSMMFDHRISTLAGLPNELLGGIAGFLTTPELRLLGRTNRRFKAFADHYLTLYRHKSAFFRLPIEILHRILDCIFETNTRRDRYASELKPGSRFARVSHKFYPLLMEHLVRYDIKNHWSSSLMDAIRRNSIDMARKIITLGSYVNSCGWVGAPLEIAASHGNNSMMHLLMKAGASQVGSYGHRYPLLRAFESRHEETASLLMADVDEGDILNEYDGETFLYKLCRHEFVDLTRKVLGRSNPQETQKDRIWVRSRALHRYLGGHARADGDSRRLFHDSLYEITKLLLNHGADPEVEATVRWNWPRMTIRDLGSRNPDPRVNALFVRDILDADYTEKVASDPGRLATLWEFVKQSHEQSVSSAKKARFHGHGFGGKQAPELPATQATQKNKKDQDRVSLRRSSWRASDVHHSNRYQLLGPKLGRQKTRRVPFSRGFRKFDLEAEEVRIASSRMGCLAYEMDHRK